MNSTVTATVTADQPAAVLPLQPPRSSFSCDRHPDENFTGFCPLCLCERLTTLDQSAINAANGASSSSRRNSTSSSTAAAAIKAIFRVPSSSSSNFSDANKGKTTSSKTAETAIAAATVTTARNSFLPELRRTKSFSASKNEGLSISACVYEPQRKSCDVRGRNTLWSLFSIHDENKPRNSNSYSQQQSLINNGVVLETNREVEEEEEDLGHNDDEIDEIRVTEEVESKIMNEIENKIVENVAEIEEKKDENETIDVLKPMKDHLDLDSQSKKPSLSNLWSAASVLSKKWQKWRRKQKKSDVSNNGVMLSSKLPAKKQPISRQFRETQSEIADYGYGRRSCDTDPRFSLDAGRMSFDDPRYSFDEPRASWDGYLIGRTFPRLPPMVEDVPVVHVPRIDTQILVEDPSMADDNLPGGSTQTREYYLDSSSKRRKSLDRSNSIRKMAAAVVAELDESKITPIVSNTKVSPAIIDNNNNNPVYGSSKFSNVTIDNEPPRVSNSNSLRDDCCSETFELGFRDNSNGIGVEKKEMKKSRRWSWKLWGFIHRRSSNKEDDEDQCSSVNGVGRSYSESWQDLRREGNNNNDNIEPNGGMINKKIFRSNSSVSWRSSSYNMRKSNSKMNGKIIGNEFGNGKTKRNGDDPFVLERNRSARYSPTHIDNGLLRFYLAPMSSSRRSGGIGIASRAPTTTTTNSHSISRSMLGLY